MDKWQIPEPNITIITISCLNYFSTPKHWNTLFTSLSSGTKVFYFLSNPTLFRFPKISFSKFAKKWHFSPNLYYTQLRFISKRNQTLEEKKKKTFHRVQSQRTQRQEEQFSSGDEVFLHFITSQGIPSFVKWNYVPGLLWISDRKSPYTTKRREIPVRPDAHSPENFKFRSKAKKTLSPYRHTYKFPLERKKNPSFF